MDPKIDLQKLFLITDYCCIVDDWVISWSRDTLLNWGWGSVLPYIVYCPPTNAITWWLCFLAVTLIKT